MPRLTAILLCALSLHLLWTCLTVCSVAATGGAPRAGLLDLCERHDHSFRFRTITRSLTMIIAQISDPHISQIGGDSDRKYATADRLQRAIAHLMRLPAPPDVVLVTGDCGDSGSAAEYERFRDLLRPLT